MLPANLKNSLTEQFDYRVRFDEPMAAHTSFRVGGPADVLVMPSNREELMWVLRQLQQFEIPWFIIGGGSNLVVTDKGIRGAVISLRKGFRRIVREGALGRSETVYVEAGARLSELCRCAVENGLAGMNFAVGIPGTVGGAVVMNAGTAKGAMEGVITEIEVLRAPDGLETLKRERLSFSYRKLDWDTALADGNTVLPIILAARIKLQKADPAVLAKEAEALLDERWKKQPRGLSAGCVFKNPSPDMPAGELIDRAGLKGFRIGDAQVSEKHANFILNTRRASAADILRLMDAICTTVARDFNIDLESEVRIVGEK